MGSSGPGGRAECRRPVLCGSQGAVTRPAVGGCWPCSGVGVLTLHLCSLPTGSLLPEQPTLLEEGGDSELGQWAAALLADTAAQSRSERSPDGCRYCRRRREVRRRGGSAG
ncbi:unnamed protein product [Rangifer tarandus platyrhynchus]|uniref:Uncharacterized protein n=1 Tax=Rangifer tarandus platyrhynchus TaxID=3082113 RepID=A0ABN8Z3X5_RANTA|nr:unnamed protein product [Rangifer tarandus platyrhynchus]